ncbi:LpqN/LpqT family lipoprotein [Agrobacterium sp. NPDC090283]|uniref:LpqN/LpqT family lipoprotein n=1 Tax=Agrobacterium sp. NPDC090283 TaxID=3363920 RepID=UPI00383B9A7F
MIEPFLAKPLKLRMIGLVSCAMIGLFAVGLKHTAAAEPTAVPGTTVTMTPPEGFVAATDFAGFLDMENQGSFFVAEMPGAAFVQLSPLFADEDLAKRSFATKGITITGRQEIETAAGETVPLLHGTQAANGVVLDKWMALYGGEKTVMITFQIPQDSALDVETMKTVFASVSTSAAPAIDDKLSALPFEIEAVEPFRVVEVLGGGSVLMMVGDKDVDPEGLQPMVVVAVSQTHGDMSNLAAVSERSLRETAGFEAAEITAKDETTFAGMDGFVLRGTYDDEGIKKNFVQYIGVKEGRALRLVGTVVVEKAAELKDAIDEIAASVELKD